MQFYYRFQKDIKKISSLLTAQSKRSYSSKNLYDILQISPNASQTQIKAAYFRLSKKYHPDVNKEPDAQTNFNKISEAYKTLSNAGLKKDYDSVTFGRGTGTQGGYAHQDFRYKEATTYKVWRNKAGYQTGKTSYYDFDEFYRKHYQDMINKSREEKINRERYEQYKRERHVGQSNIRAIHSIVTTCVFLLLIVSSLK